MSEVQPGWAVGTHDLIWVEGPDAVSFLDGQISQDVAGMDPGAVARAFLLEPRGKLRALLWVLRGEDRVGLLTPAGSGERVRDDLNRFRFRVAAAIRDDDRAVASWWGSTEDRPGWLEAAGEITAVLPATAPGRVVIGGNPPAPTLGPLDVDAHRVLAGEPRFGSDVDEGTIPQETGLVPEAVSFTKGCYLGQELVARIDSRGHVNRALRRIHLSTAAPVGAEVSVGDTVVGTLGTVAPVGDDWMALALLRREVQPGDLVTIGAVTGSVAAIPGR